MEIGFLQTDFMDTLCEMISVTLEQSGARDDCSCRLLIVPLFRGISRFESVILSRYSRFTCECNKEKVTEEITLTPKPSTLNPQH